MIFVVEATWAGLINKWIDSIKLHVVISPSVLTAIGFADIWKESTYTSDHPIWNNVEIENKTADTKIIHFVVFWSLGYWIYMLYRVDYGSAYWPWVN